MLPTFKSWTVHKIIDYLTFGLLSSLWNIYHSTTAYFFDPPCAYFSSHHTDICGTYSIHVQLERSQSVCDFKATIRLIVCMWIRLDLDLPAYKDSDVVEQSAGGFWNISPTLLSHEEIRKQLWLASGEPFSHALLSYIRYDRWTRATHQRCGNLGGRVGSYPPNYNIGWVANVFCPPKKFPNIYPVDRTTLQSYPVSYTHLTLPTKRIV